MCNNYDERKQNLKNDIFRLMEDAFKDQPIVIDKDNIIVDRVGDGIYNVVCPVQFFFQEELDDLIYKCLSELTKETLEKLNKDK